MKKTERENRIIARGEVSGHSHIITGECTIERNKESVIIHAGKNCAIKHLLEKPFVEQGLEVWSAKSWTFHNKKIEIRHGDVGLLNLKKEFDKPIYES